MSDTQPRSSDSRPPDWPAAVYDHPLPQRLHDIGAGRATLPPHDGKRHHFVPQLILRGFESPRKLKHLAHLDKLSGRFRLVPIASAAFEDRLYAARNDDGQYDNRIESFLGLIETYAAPALGRLLDGTATEDEALPISLLFGLQISRTPPALAGVGATLERLGHETLVASLHDRELFARIVSETRGVTLNADDVEEDRMEYLALVDDGLRLRLDGQRHAALDVMVRGFVEAGLAMAHADWWILHASHGNFVLSDCGYARFVEEDKLPVPHGLLFPVRHDVCIAIAPPSTEDMRVVRAAASAGEVERINLRSYGWAERFIFGRSADPLTRVHAASRKNPRGARPPRLRERLPAPP